MGNSHPVGSTIGTFSVMAGSTLRNFLNGANRGRCLR
jgi:hypothetical protein